MLGLSPVGAVLGHRSFTRSNVYLRRMLTYPIRRASQRRDRAHIRGAITPLAMRAVLGARLRAGGRRVARGMDPTVTLVARDPRLPSPGTLLRKEAGCTSARGARA